MARDASQISRRWFNPERWIGFFLMPARWVFGQRIAAVMELTWKAAFRFRLFLVLAVLLIASVVLLPLVIKDDGTARGFTQILMTYTLSVITGLLGISTLWLACGTLARDVEECQIQVVAVKPIPRWQIWLGKYLGILSLNAVLLALSGVSVYALVQWRADKLPPTEQAVLRNQVLVARGALHEASLEPEIQSLADKHVEQLQKAGTIPPEELPLVRKQSLAWARAQLESVQSGQIRPWLINVGLLKNRLKDRPLFLRVKFNAAEKSPNGTFITQWQVGVPTNSNVWREEMSLSPDTYHEFEVGSNLFDAEGRLPIVMYNSSPVTLNFPLKDGLEVLYPESSFAVNFARGLGILFCWMALLAAVGLAMASFMSFPVAAFASLALLTIALSSGTLASAVSEGTVLGYDAQSGQTHRNPIDLALVELFRVMLTGIKWVTGFSPIDALSTGHSITWSTLGMAFVQIVLVVCGVVGVFGIWAFDLRELATAQGTH